MSRFKPSSETAKHPVMKILLWGPPGAGKTHFMMGAPKLALIDVETRASNFAVRRAKSGQLEFDFVHAEVSSLVDFAEILKEIRDGKVDCESVGVDSGSAIYLKFVEEHTALKETNKGRVYTTDYVTVNRRFISSLNFVFSLSGKNLIYSMHSAIKYEHDGNNLKPIGTQFVGDEKFRFGFDYIFRLQPQGDPTKNPPVFHCEKTSSPNLKLGAAIPGLTFAQLRDICHSSSVAEGKTPAAERAAPPASPPPAQHSNGNGKPMARPQKIERVAKLRKELDLDEMQIGTFVHGCCKHRTSLYGELNDAELDHLIVVLEKRRPAVRA